MAKELATTQLTELQERFVIAIVRNGGKQEEAAIEAGYSPASARTVAYANMRLPHVQRALHAARERKIKNLATTALGVLEDILQDDDAPRPLRAEVARHITAMAGHSVQERIANKNQGDDDEPLDEKSPEELQEIINKGNELLREKTKAIPHAEVIDVPDSSQESGVSNVEGVE